MQRTPQHARATTASTTMSENMSASIHAKTSALGAVQGTPSALKGGAFTSTSTSASSALAQSLRRALQPLDSNRVLPAPPPAVAKAPFAYVSRFSRPLPTPSATTTTTTAVGTAAKKPTATATAPAAASASTSLTGLKRKQRHVDEIVAGPPKQKTRLTNTDSSRVDTEDDPTEQQRRENVAWLDMLVALLERKYQAYAAPVCVDDLERAKMLDAYWPTATKQPDAAVPTAPPSSTSKRSRLSLVPSSSTNASNPTSSSSHDEKEEKRLQALRRHAQQIQDTSVSSTSCCGCKTGCLKMYCVCFSTRGYCHDGCNCDNCKNARASADARLDAITTYLTNDPRAFSYAAATANANSGFFQLLPEKASTVVLRGCRCKKSKCLKKYCECFQNGLGCGPHCRCVDCSNDSSSAARELRAKNKSEAVSGGGDGRADAKPMTISGSASGSGSASASGSGSGTGGTFHAIKVGVTKKPRRNGVLKSVRLRL